MCLRNILPVVFCRVHQVIYLGIDELENALFCRFLIIPKFFRCVELQWATGGSRRSCTYEQQLKFLASCLKMF